MRVPTFSAPVAAPRALQPPGVRFAPVSRAAELFAEDDSITHATGAPPIPTARFVLAAWRGRKSEALGLYATMVDDARVRGEGATLGSSEVSLAYLHNGLGSYDDALAAATSPWEHDELSYSSVATDALTAHELTIARLVATGATSREVGAQLFLSPDLARSKLISGTSSASSTSRPAAS